MSDNIKITVKNGEGLSQAILRELKNEKPDLKIKGSVWGDIQQAFKDDDTSSIIHGKNETNIGDAWEPLNAKIKIYTGDSIKITEETWNEIRELAGLKNESKKKPVQEKQEKPIEVKSEQQAKAEVDKPQIKKFEIPKRSRISDRPRPKEVQDIFNYRKNGKDLADQYINGAAPNWSKLNEYNIAHFLNAISIASFVQMGSIGYDAEAYERLLDRYVNLNKKEIDKVQYLIKFDNLPEDKKINKIQELTNWVIRHDKAITSPYEA